jgi:hypothetical protein
LTSGGDGGSSGPGGDEIESDPIVVTEPTLTDNTGEGSSGSSGGSTDGSSGTSGGDLSSGDLTSGSDGSP